MNIFVLLLCWRDIDRFCKRAGVKDFHVVLFLVLTILIPFAAIFTYIIVQNRMNAAHEAATGGAAVNAPLDRADWTAIVVGWALVILALLVGVAN